MELSKSAKLPKRRKHKPICPQPIADAMSEYAKAYRLVFKRMPVLEYEAITGFTRIEKGEAVNTKRLKELTRMLRERAKDL